VRLADNSSTSNFAERKNTTINVVIDTRRPRLKDFESLALVSKKRSTTFETGTSFFVKHFWPATLIHLIFMHLGLIFKILHCSTVRWRNGSRIHQLPPNNLAMLIVSRDSGNC
jgi:hypothetical protein